MCAYKEWTTEERAEQSIKFYEAMRNGMPREEAFEKFIETKLSPGEIRVLEEEDAIFESTGVRPKLHMTPEEKVEADAHWAKVDARNERTRTMPKFLYEVDDENMTVTKLSDVPPVLDEIWPWEIKIPVTED